MPRPAKGEDCCSTRACVPHSSALGLATSSGDRRANYLDRYIQKDHDLGVTLLASNAKRRLPLARSSSGLTVHVSAVLDQQLGHVKVQNVKMPSFVGVAEMPTSSLEPGMSREEKEKEGRALKSIAERKVSEHFSNMRKAFHFVDVDNSGTVDAKEIRRAMHMWGVDLDDAKLAMLMSQCDSDGDGQIEYNEFIDPLSLTHSTHRHTAHPSHGPWSSQAGGLATQTPRRTRTAR